MLEAGRHFGPLAALAGHIALCRALTTGILLHNRGITPYLARLGLAAESSDRTEPAAPSSPAMRINATAEASMPDTPEPEPKSPPAPSRQIPEIPPDWFRKGDLPDEPPKEL